MKQNISTLHNISRKIPKADVANACFKYIYYPKLNNSRKTEGGLRTKGKFKYSLFDKPLVTVITVVRNGQKTIENCILSVIRQKYDNIEYIIIDGDSGDNTLKIISKYRDYIDYYLSEKDSGIYEAMNKGLSLASGDYIYILNADDQITHYGLYEIFSNNNYKKADVIITSVRMIDGEKNYIVVPEAIDESVYISIPPLHPGTIYHKKVYNFLGGYSTQYKRVSDWEFFLRVYSHGKFKFEFLYVLLNNFLLTGVSSGKTKEDIDRHLHEREMVIKHFFRELSHNETNFLARVHWKSLDEIISYFSKYEEKKFSEKIVISLKKLIIKKMEEPFADERTMPYPFKKIEKKNEMIDDVRKILPLAKPPKDNCIVVCLASDENYEPHLWVTVSSLLDEVRMNVDYYIYILDGGIENKQAFYDLINKNKKIHIHFVDMKKYFISALESRHIKKAAYYRLAILYLFKNFNRVIYLDADSYVLSDIYELYNIPMQEKQIAGSRDSITFQKSLREYHIEFGDFSGTRLDYYKKYLKLSDNRIKLYFSSGVLLFNIKNINVELKKKKMEELLNRDFYCHDQDILNLLFDEKEIFVLDRKWNYFNIATALPIKDYIKKEEKLNYYDIAINPKIISYVLKPWLIQYSNSDFADLYWKKIIKSPYYNEIVKNIISQSKLESAKKAINVTETSLPLLYNFGSKIKFAIFSPKKFTKKYCYKLLNSPLRQPVRKIWYAIRFKKLK